MKKTIRAVVYTHTLDGVIFYVGLSKRYKSRPYDTSSRHNDWHDFAKGRKPQIALYYFDDCLLAARAELLMIYKHRDTVVNKDNRNDIIEPSPLGYRDGYMRGYCLPL